MGKLAFKETSDKARASQLLGLCSSRALGGLGTESLEARAGSFLRAEAGYVSFPEQPGLLTIRKMSPKFKPRAV